MLNILDDKKHFKRPAKCNKSLQFLDDCVCMYMKLYWKIPPHLDLWMPFLVFYNEHVVSAIFAFKYMHMFCKSDIMWTGFKQINKHKGENTHSYKYLHYCVHGLRLGSPTSKVWTLKPSSWLKLLMCECTSENLNCNIWSLYYLTLRFINLTRILWIAWELLYLMTSQA